MKILTFINYIQKLTRTHRLFVRARNYGLNELTNIIPVYVVPNKHEEDTQMYGKYRYAHDMDRNPELVYELIFREPD